MDAALEVIARIARVESGTLKPDTTMAKLGLHSSLGLGILQSALERRFQRKLCPFTWETTVAQVLGSLDGLKPASPTAFPESAATSSVGKKHDTHFGPFGGRTRWQPVAQFPHLGHGVDIQEIAAMPEWAGDAAASPFYAGHFTAAELAAGAVRPSPRAHFCGIWCAKEAIRKSDPELARLDFLEIVIGHDQSGKPWVSVAAASGHFEISLSISHSAAYAVASAITLRR